VVKVDRINILVGNRVRELRKKKGWSQEELAFEAGVHYTFVGKVERGESNLSLESVVKMTRALSVSLEEFFGTIEPNLSNSNTILIEIFEKLKDKSIVEQEYILKMIFLFDQMLDKKNSN
jgi:XRE family transcriptional regulator, regulator of sulfur utilization